MAKPSRYDAPRAQTISDVKARPARARYLGAGSAPSTLAESAMDTDEDQEDIFTFSEEDRRSILASIGLANGPVANKLIVGCEIATEDALHNWSYFSSLPNDKETRRVLNEIFWHISEIIRIASFDDNIEVRDKFWKLVLLNRRGELPSWRWYSFRRLFNQLIFAGNFIFAVLHGHKKSVRLCDENFSIKSNRELTGNRYLKDLALVYWYAFGKPPGRSKSTIGPFVKFAHATMVAFAGELAPSIDTLNERWARLDFDPRKARLNEAALKDYCRNRGIEYPY